MKFNLSLFSFLILVCYNKNYYLTQDREDFLLWDNVIIEKIVICLTDDMYWIQ